MTYEFVPPIYPDETIYSYAARLHVYWAEKNHRKTAKRLFGKAPINIDQRLPLGIEHIARATGNEIDTLLQHHTFYPLFSGFVSCPIALKEAMLSNSGKNLANASSVAQAGIAPLGGSRYCPLCIDQDTLQYGIAYWHLSHQLQGVTCCTTHDVELVQVEQCTRKFELPPQQDESNGVIASQEALRLARLLLRFNSDFEFNIPDCREDYWGGPSELLRLKNQYRGQNVNMAVLMEAVNLLSEEIFSFSILSENVVFKLIHCTDYYCHPTKHIFLCFVLDLLPAQQPETSVSRDKYNQMLERDRFRCISIYQSGITKLRPTSRAVDRSVNYVKSIARQMGVKYQKRTKFITPDIEARIIAKAKAGLHRQTIAHEEGVSVPTVELFINGVLGLSDKRRNLRKESRRKYARQALLNTMSNLPELTRKNIKKAIYADYMWLYRHDKTWLYQTLPAARNHTKL
ncbi:MAG TPA: hypothetical protein DG048_24150 [Pseudoalteromonas sp.]|nr:hypothetical protein [Pseudoalteromonas sp.]|tara:strand:+ start:1269 stop:2642 length:1374 start_codon:yes stop_codon:yes gene_type:complete